MKGSEECSTTTACEQHSQTLSKISFSFYFHLFFYRDMITEVVEDRTCHYNIKVTLAQTSFVPLPLSFSLFPPSLSLSPLSVVTLSLSLCVSLPTLVHFACSFLLAFSLQVLSLQVCFIDSTR